MIAKALSLLDRVSVWCAALAGVCLGLMTLLMLAEVVARNAFAQSLTFSWEFSGYLMGATFFFGAAYTLRSNGHVRVSMLAEVVPAKVARGLEYFCTLVGILVTGYILYALFDLTLISYQRDVKSFTPTETPMILPQGILAFGAALLFLQMVGRLVRLWRNEPPDIAPRDAVLGSDQ
jgi:TRAP-type C4-dicarboxylate transport system permease small subunit